MRSFPEWCIIRKQRGGKNCIICNSLILPCSAAPRFRLVASIEVELHDTDKRGFEVSDSLSAQIATGLPSSGSTASPDCSPPGTLLVWCRAVITKKKFKKKKNIFFDKTSSTYKHTYTLIDQQSF